MTHVGAVVRDRTLGDAVARGLTEGLGRESVSIRRPLGPGELVIVHTADESSQALEHGSVVVLDGEIHTDLRGRSVDASKVLQRFIDEGERSLGSVDATAGWTFFDAQAGRVVAARDPVGNGSMFFYRRGSAVLWSPRLRDLRAAVGSRDIDWEAADFFIANGFVPSPWTMFEGLERLGPGELIEVDDETVRRRRYHDFRTTPSAPAAETLDDVLREELPEAVAARISDVERTGTLLSGGIDSQLVTALATSQAGQPPATYTFRYLGYEGPINEGDRARRCAELLGAPHRLLDVDPHRLVNRLPSLLSGTAEPMARTIHTVLLDSAREMGSTELLTGDGADSLYLNGGDRKALALAWLPRSTLKLLASTSGALSQSVESLSMRRRWSGIGAAATFLDGFARAAARASHGLNVSLESEFLRYPERAGIYRDPNVALQGRRALLELVESERARLEGLPLRDQLRILELRFDGADDLLRRNLDIAQSNETVLRSPFFSLRLMNRWLQHPVPTRASIRRTSREHTKQEVRRLAGTLLPRELAETPKRGHSIPIHPWLRGPLLPWIREVTAKDHIHRLDALDPNAIGRLLDAHLDEGRQLGWVLWTIGSLCVWADQINSTPRPWLAGFR